VDTTKEALQYIVGLDKAEILEINGQKYSTKGLSHIEHPKPDTIEITTLTGLVDYIKSDIDSLIKTELLVQVVSPTLVKLHSKILDDANRVLFISAKAQLPNTTLGTFMPVENFIIMLQSSFVENEDSESILKVVGNITEENVRTTGDDGISQSVTARTGIAKVGNVVLPNPVILRPYRTFVEVDQPVSKFIFRMQDGPKAALIEADGGAWKSTAMWNIKEYLEVELKDTGVKIIS
jgi:hypothetical protein